MPKSVGRAVGKKGKRPSTSQIAVRDIEKANARFDRLLEAMAKAPPLPKRKKRVRTREVPDEKFDD